ncbi:MAG: DUF6044 family protein [Sphingomicrobium sp.]
MRASSNRLYWALAAIVFYLPLLVLRVIEPDDLLNSELVYNRAIGSLWRGDPSISHDFLVGHVPVLSLSRLTQPLMVFYALLPPFPAYVLNDFVVRSVGAAGALLLLKDLEVRDVTRNVAATLFAFGLTNTTFGLSIAGLPLAAYLMTQRGRAAPLGLLLIGWNSSLYLSGLFFLAASPLLHRFVLQRQLEAEYWRSWLAYAAGLLFGNVGLIWLTIMPHPLWQRAEWGIFPPVWPFPYRYLALPLLPLFAGAAIIGWRSRQVRYVACFAAFAIAWYGINQLPWAQLHRPAGIQVDRFYMLWPLALLLIIGLADRAAAGAPANLLAVGTMLGCVAALAPQQHLRQIVRIITGSGGGYPSFGDYYHTAWYREAKLDGPVLSIGIDPMSAPMNGVASIDGYFPLYPLEYKHAFQRVYNDALIASWGSKLYAKPGANYCAARALGARYVVSSVPLTSSVLKKTVGGELSVYRIAC